MPLNRLFHVLQTNLSKSGFIVNLAIRVRNQCNAIIKYRLGPTADSFKNGEFLILGNVAPLCKIVADVGANKGTWTEQVTRVNSSVNCYIFEPSPEAVALLNNKFFGTTNVTIIPKAVSDQNGVLTFFQLPGIGETSSLVRPPKTEIYEEIPVQVCVLDAELEKHNILEVDFLKIDVEGYDLHALRGAQTLLEKRKINFIQFEYNKTWAAAGSTLYSALQLLTNYEYTVFIIRPDGLYYYNYETYSEFFEYSNFFAVSKEQFKAITHLIKGKF